MEKEIFNKVEGANEEQSKEKENKSKWMNKNILAVSLVTTLSIIYLKFKQ